MFRFFKRNKLKSQDFGFYQKITPPESIRKIILDFILNDTDSVILNDDGQKISKTNWILKKYDDPIANKKRRKKLNKFFNKHFGKIFKDHFGQPVEISPLSADSFTLVDTWYQVYAKNSGGFHCFHNHANEESHTSAIFYVKLHDKELLTQFRIGDSVVTPDAEEGDIIIFDSNIYHASPPNYTDHDKIIVSFNFNLKNNED